MGQHHRIQKFLTPIAAEKAIVEEALSEQKESISELEEISETLKKDCLNSPL